MAKKIAFGIYILGLLLIASGIFFQYTFWFPFKGDFPPLNGNSELYSITYPVIGKIVLDPYELYVFSDLFVSAKEVIFFSFFRTLVLVMCGIGLIQRNNVARYGLFALIALRISPFFFLLANIHTWRHAVLIFGVPVIYTLYLIHPNVRKQFE